ncbi:Integral membrane protein [Sarcoptes scabiei]|nr:Integral membrane protein [Sarcoptes scabiei]
MMSFEKKKTDQSCCSSSSLIQKSPSTAENHGIDDSAKLGHHCTSNKEKIFDELFDSGYESNIQSKTFLDSDLIDNDLPNDSSKPDASDNIFESKQQKSINFLPAITSSLESTSDSKFQLKQQPKWTDSGCCITESDININEDENLELIYSREDSDENFSSQSNIYGHHENIQVNSLPLESWLKQNNGETLLHLAIIEGLEDVACSIIQHLSPNTSHEILNSYNYLYQNALHLAVLKQQTNLAQQLLLKRCSLLFQDNFGNTPLHIACKYSLFDMCKLILKTAPKETIAKCLEIRNYDGQTCLHLAAYNYDLKSLELMILSGANIDQQEGKSGKTILHWAIENLQVQLVYFLYKNHANMLVQSFSGQTPFDYVLRLLTKNGLHNPTTPLSRVNSRVQILRLSWEYCKKKHISMAQIVSNNRSELISSNNLEDSDSSDNDEETD